MTALETARPASLDTLSALRAGRARRRRRRSLAVASLTLVVFALIVVTLCVGNTFYTPAEVFAVITGQDVAGATFTVGTLRLPRMLAGLLAGVAFGMAGAAFQTMLRNPLASPDIIGITSGASAAAIVSILVLGWGSIATSTLAVVVGLVTAAVIFFVSRSSSGFGARLVLIGIGVGALMDAVVSYVMLRANQYDLPEAMRWLTGSLSGQRWEELPPLAIAMVVLVPLMILLTRDLKALELGDATATSFGVRVDRTRLLLVLSAVALAAFATATTGPIAFVAFLAAPIAVGFTGPGTSLLIPAGLTGAVLVLAGDLIGQFALDTRFPVGIITGILGAPYLLFLLMRRTRFGGIS